MFALGVRTMTLKLVQKSSFLLYNFVYKIDELPDYFTGSILGIGFRFYV